jgi:hypothetical protein
MIPPPAGKLKDGIVPSIANCADSVYELDGFAEMQISPTYKKVYAFRIIHRIQGPPNAQRSNFREFLG